MRRFLLSLLFLSGVSAPAQVLIPNPFLAPVFPLLKTYLGLTEAQIMQIVTNLDEYGRLVAQRQQRINQVQSEVQQETEKSPLDPAALGIRYAEIETICRNVREEAAAAQNRNLTLLTDVQKAKLKVLEDAYKLLPVITEAQSAGVLAPPGPYAPFSGLIFSGISAAVLSGCQQPTLASARKEAYN
jgi:hypothetical protein